MHRILILLLFPLFVNCAFAATPEPVKALEWETPNDNDLRILQLKLGRYLLEDIVTAYQYKEGVYIPLGLFSQSVGLAIDVRPEEGVAEGFVLQEDRRFYLDFSRKELTLSGVTSKLDAKDIKLFQDDIYLHESVFERVFPVKLNIDLFSLQLFVETKEPFPLQSKIDREERVSKIRTHSSEKSRDYADYASPYKDWDYPFIDTTAGLSYRQAQDGSVYSDITYSTYLTSDLGYLETSAYFSGASDNLLKSGRITFSRHDPAAGLLGGMQAREYSFGYVNLPSISNVTQHQSYIPGVVVSNFELNQQTNFESHTFQGLLLPGWEVELYQNDILIAYTSEAVNGEYRFDNIPLLFGNNFFRLAFYGPRGEYREETYTFILNNSLTRSGEYHYRLGLASDPLYGAPRVQIQSDYGISKNLTAYANITSLNLTDGAHSYVNLGVAGFLNYMFARMGYTQDTTGGSLTDLAVQTRYGSTNLSLNYALMDSFSSETLTESDPVVSSSTVRIDSAIPRISSLPRLPLSFSFNQEDYESGAYKSEMQNRISMYTKEIAVVNEITDVVSTVGVNSTSGTMSLSAHRFSYSLRGDINYDISPSSGVSSVSVNYTAKSLGPYSYDMGFSRFSDSVMQYVVGVHKRSNMYAYDLNLGYKTDGEISLSTNMSVNFGYDKKKDDWKISSIPMAGKGAAVVNVYLDENYNGIRDADEKGLKDIDVVVNGVRRFVKSNEDGHIFLTDLAVYQELDLGVSIDTLVDPLYIPKVKGYRSVYRPGHVHEYNFPIILTGEIDGTTFVNSKGKTRNIGDVEVVLINDKGEVVKKVKSAYDGFYVISQVPKGTYTLKVSEEQKKRLNLSVADKKITLKQDDMFISGADVVIKLK